MHAAETIIITGSTGNLGQTITRKMVDLGYNVIATKEPGDPFEFGDHPSLRLQSIDLMDEHTVYEWVKRAGATGDKIRAGLLLVGGFAMGDLEKTKGQDLRNMFRLNFFTGYHVLRPLLEVFKKQGPGGQVILIGARPALQPGDAENMVSYALSKSLLFRLAEIINASEKTHGVRATVIVPSIIDTPGNRAAMPDADPDEWVPPQSIAEAIAFLLSESGRMLREPVFKIYNRS